MRLRAKFEACSTSAGRTVQSAAKADLRSQENTVGPPPSPAARNLVNLALTTTHALASAVTTAPRHFTGSSPELPIHGPSVNFWFTAGSPQAIHR